MKKLFRLFIMTAFLVVLIYAAINTFGLFESEGIGVTKQDVGKWIVKINNVDITKPENATFKVTEFNYEEDAKVADGKIAPGSVGYFDVVIDPSGSDVSVRYDIDFDFSIYETLPSVQITVQDLTGGEIIKTGENKYTGVIKLNEIKNNKTNTLRVKINWVNDENNNDYDSTLGTTPNSKITIPINIKAIQYTNETITPYSG